jgi:hypothetical protein
VFGDEIVINDPAVALSRGRGLVAPSFVDSSLGIDKLFAHFPPVFIYLQAVIFRVFGVSAYSLRLLTTVMSIAAAAVFVFIIDRLYRWNLVERRTGLLVACLYTLGAPVIILHRMSRMESLIECLSLISLYCILRVIFRIPEQVEVNGSNKQRARGTMVWVLMGSLLAGLSLATHPEAITAVLPIGLLILLAARINLGQKVAAVALLALTPSGIWLATYGRHWQVALYQMLDIARYKAPEPSFSRFGLALLRKSTSSQHDFMVLFFFVLTVSAMVLVMIRTLSASSVPKTAADPVSRRKLAIYTAFSIAIPLTFIILIFLLPASITRYEVIYPVYLVIIAIPPPVRSRWPRIYMPLRTAVGVLILAQFVGCIVYLTRDAPSADVLASRYDAVLNCIPAGPRVAASPQLWLAFERKDRPFTLLYPGLDGFDKWKSEFAEPLQSFDLIC